MEFNKTLKTRKSTRGYKTKQITDEELSKVLYAAYAAPVGNGLYEDIHITVLQNSDLINRIVKSSADAFNDPNANPFYGAPTIVFVSSKIKEASKESTTYANAGCIIENMHLAATDIGLGSVYLLGFIKAGVINDSYKKELGIPEGYKPVSAIALGYPTDKLVERDIPANKISTNYIR